MKITSTKDLSMQLKKKSRVRQVRLMLNLHLNSHQSVSQINAAQDELVGCSKGRNNLSAGGVITLLRKTE